MSPIPKQALNIQSFGLRVSAAAMVQSLRTGRVYSKGNRRLAFRSRTSPQCRAEPSLQERFQSLQYELSDTSQLGKRGEELVALQLGAVTLCIVQPGWVDRVVQASGVTCVLGGLGIIYLAQRDLGDMLSPLPSPREEQTLVDTGLYQYMRHPMYTGLLLAMGGIALASESPGRAAAVLFLYKVLVWKMNREEKDLMQCVPGYEEYMERVPRLVPSRSMLLEGKPYSTGGVGSDTSSGKSGSKSTGSQNNEQADEQDEDEQQDAQSK